MFYIEILIPPKIFLSNESLLKTIVHLKVWARVVKGKFVSQKADIINALLAIGNKKAVKIVQKMEDFDELLFDTNDVAETSA